MVEEEEQMILYRDILHLIIYQLSQYSFSLPGMKSYIKGYKMI